ncbi:MAG: hypothetical protein N2595_02835, partial [bacterium]|nr:hypothetical protein [bacterium]
RGRGGKVVGDDVGAVVEEGVVLADELLEAGRWRGGVIKQVWREERGGNIGTVVLGEKRAEEVQRDSWGRCGEGEAAEFTQTSVKEDEVTVAQGGKEIVLPV